MFYSAPAGAACYSPALPVLGRLPRMFIVPQGTTPAGKLECVFDRAAGMRAAKRSAVEKEFFRSLFRCPMKVLLMPGQAAGPGSIFSKPLPCKFSPKKPTLRMAGPGGRPPGTEPEFRFLFGKGEKRGRKFFIFKGLEKPLSAEIQGT